MIQDTIFFVGGLILIATLWPIIKNKVRQPRLTSVPVAAIMYAFTINSLTLNLPLAAASYFLTGVGWTYIALRLKK